MNTCAAARIPNRAFAAIATCGVFWFSGASTAQNLTPKTLTHFEIGADFVNPARADPWAW